MPIRFRCAYCNQLMGISHRKAGKVVRCPKCAGEIIVPVPDGMEPPEEPGQEAAGPHDEMYVASQTRKGSAVYRIANLTGKGERRMPTVKPPS